MGGSLKPIPLSGGTQGVTGARGGLRRAITDQNTKKGGRPNACGLPPKDA